GIMTAAGAPQVGVMMMYAAEGQEAYDQAIADGTSEEDASMSYVIYGSVAAVLEQMQLQGIMKIGKGMFRQLANRTAQKVTRKGLRSLTRDMIKVAAQEALEEMAQGTWQEVTAKLIYDKSVPGGVAGFIDRRAQEGYIGAVMGVVAGGAGVTAGKIQQAKTELTRVKPTPEVTEKPITEVPTVLLESYHMCDH
ncbi:unnamed protein product, partial [marine sediment metagenome]